MVRYIEKTVKYAILGLFLLLSPTAHATENTFDFDSYTVGSALAGQGPWIYLTTSGVANSLVISSTTSSTSPNAVFANGGARPMGFDIGTSSEAISYEFDIYLSNVAGGSSVAWNRWQVFKFRGLNSNYEFGDGPFSFGVRGNGMITIANGDSTGANLSAGWNKVRSDTYFSSTTQAYQRFIYIDDVLAYHATGTLSSSTLPNYFGGFGSTNPIGVDVYLDNLTVTTDADAPLSPDFPTTTRIISFTPEDGETVAGPDVDFTLQAYVNQDDIGSVRTIQITLENIDQNVLLLGFLSPSNIQLVDENITAGGLYNYSTTTTLGEGNYRLEACVVRTLLGGTFGDLFTLSSFLSDVYDCQSHQFVVGSSTFIGSISQNIWGQTNDFLEGLSATSSEALASTCNLLSSNFGIRECLTFLFVPDASDLRDTMELAREGILSRFPWGYANRFVDILITAPTTTLPSFTHTIYYGSGSDETPDSTTITFDPGDMIAGGGALADSIEDRNGNTLRDALEPIVQFILASLVIMIIVFDVMGMGASNRNGDSRRGNLS